MTEASRDLVERALGGDPGARGLLAERLVPIIEKSVRRALAGRRDALGIYEAADLEQEVWLALLKGEGRQLLAFDPERASLEAYVQLIARREVSNRLRGRGRGREISGLSAEPSSERTPESGLVERTALDALLQHLEASLPDRGRAVFTALFREDHTPPEVSTRLGVETQVVYNWQHRIRKLARAFRPTHLEA